MLSGTYSGTDLSYAYINDIDYGSPLASSSSTIEPSISKKKDDVVQHKKADDPPKHSNAHHEHVHTHHVPPQAFMSPDEKIELLSAELRRQREQTEQQRASGGYLDKLMSKKKDMLRMVMFACVVLLALSTHFVADHYYHVFFDNNVLTPWREFFVRSIYPTLVVFLLWNIRTFVK